MAWSTIIGKRRSGVSKRRVTPQENENRSYGEPSWNAHGMPGAPQMGKQRVESESAERHIPAGSLRWDKFVKSSLASSIAGFIKGGREGSFEFCKAS